ncbi:MAG: hypothetical protein ABIT08_07885 [Bacteroidia bacterium]
MKKSLLITAVLLYPILNLNAQGNKSPTYKFLVKRNYTFPDSISTDSLNRKWPDTLYYNTVYRSKVLASPTIPISFSRVVLINGKYEVTPTISIGYGYAWFLGTFYFNETDKISVDPTLYFGLMADISLQNNLSLDKLTGLFTGVFVGLSSFTFFGGYDYITQGPILGIGGRIDLYTLRQSYLKPVGKVWEERPHKTGALPIRNE